MSIKYSSICSVSLVWNKPFYLELRNLWPIFEPTDFISLHKEVDKPIGDELLVWKIADAQGGSVLFRRTNTVIYLSGGLPLDERLTLADRLDQALQKDIPEVRHSDSVIPPEILKVDLPSTVQARQSVTAQIEVAHIAPTEAWLGTENTNVTVKGGMKPTLTYYAPEEPGQDKIVLIISTPGNLLSKKTISIEVR